MKKAIIMILAIVMVFAFVSCGKKSASTTAAPTAATTATAPAATRPAVSRPDERPPPR